MENNNQSNNKAEVSLNRFWNKILVLSAGLSVFWVIFIWGFWDKDIYALGLNAFIFLLLLSFLFFGTVYKKIKLNAENSIWLASILFIILSFLIYDNPFLKATSIIILPVIFAFYYNYALLNNNTKRHWNFYFILEFIKRFFSLFGKIWTVLIMYLELIIPAGKNNKRIIAKILAGIILFLIIALTAILPLLSSADQAFAGKVDFIYSWIKNNFSILFLYKLLVFVALSVFLASALFAWKKEFDFSEKEEGGNKIDPIISGIVLSGILILYLLFLWVQITRLWVGSLPFEFKEAEHLVKSGFWQLLFLSIINIIIYFFTYRKTVLFVQRILVVFTLASLLLLISAAYRMLLYVIYYGFSYEKFFASYAVIYCLILFIWLISRLFIKARSNIFKFLAVLFIGMYSLAVIFPVEQFILRTNLKLSKLDGSRIKLYELTMLSPDVLSLVKNYKKQGLLHEKDNDLTLWDIWIAKNESLVKDKKWYERNIINFIYLGKN